MAGLTVKSLPSLSGGMAGDGTGELVAAQGEAPTATAALRTCRYAAGALAPMSAGAFDAFPAAQGANAWMGVFG